jgi:uncharacterized protein YbcI
MNTQGEAESMICKGASQIMQGILGHGPTVVKCHIFEDTVLVRLWNKFNPLEQRLVDSRSSIITDYRSGLIDSVRTSFENMIRETFAIELLIMHHDILLPGGEEVFLFTLVSAPTFRLKMSKNGKN